MGSWLLSQDQLGEMLGELNAAVVPFLTAVLLVCV